MPKPIESPSLAKRVKRYFALIEQAKRKYEQGDVLIEGLRAKVGINQPIMVDGIAYAVSDNFEKVNHVYRPKRVSRFELRKMKPEEYERATAGPEAAA